MTDEEIIAEAKELYCDDDISIDEDHEVSRGEGGAWVRAWVFVQIPENDDVPKTTGE